MALAAPPDRGPGRGPGEVGERRVGLKPLEVEIAPVQVHAAELGRVVGEGGRGRGEPVSASSPAPVRMASRASWAWTSPGRRGEGLRPAPARTGHSLWACPRSAARARGSAGAGGLLVVVGRSSARRSSPCACACRPALLASRPGRVSSSALSTIRLRAVPAGAQRRRRPAPRPPGPRGAPVQTPDQPGGDRRPGPARRRGAPRQGEPAEPVLRPSSCVAVGVDALPGPSVADVEPSAPGLPGAGRCSSCRHWA